MDPLFERRKMTKKVHIESKFLQKNIQASILARLKMTLEGRCLSEGFIQNDSITLLNYSLGRTNYIKGGIDYDVEFQADVCMPHQGQRFRVPVVLKSKVGIHAEQLPIKVLIPRDLHFGNAEFEQIVVGTDVEFEVIGSQFKQRDTEIIVVGKLTSMEAAPVPVRPPTPPPIVEAPSSEEKVITVQPTVETKKKRKLKAGNEPSE